MTPPRGSRGAGRHARRRGAPVRRLLAGLLAAVAWTAAGCGGPGGSGSTESDTLEIAIGGDAAPAAHDSVASATLFELPPGDRRSEVVSTCTTCHSAGLLLQRRMPRTGWDETITRMQEKHGLQKLEPDLRGAILDYLAANLGAADGTAEGAEPLYPANPAW
jgi:hypothetical protein